MAPQGSAAARSRARSWACTAACRTAGGTGSPATTRASATSTSGRDDHRQRRRPRARRGALGRRAPLGSTRRNTLSFADNPASLQTGAVSWSRGVEEGRVESVSARYIEETNLYRATALGTTIFPIASRTWEVNGQYGRPASIDTPGVNVGMAYRHREAERRTVGRRIRRRSRPGRAGRGPLGLGRLQGIGSPRARRRRRRALPRQRSGRLRHRAGRHRPLHVPRNDGLRSRALPRARLDLPARRP